MLDKKDIHYKRAYYKSDSYFKIIDVFDPSTWQVVEQNKKPQPIQTDIFKQIPNFENLCIDIDHDDLGRRKYVTIADLCSSLTNKKPVKVIMEDEVKKKGYKVIVSKYVYANGNSQYNDYTIIDAYSQGNNQIILSNASVLMDPSNKNLDVFKNVNLIVNCQTSDKVQYGISSKKQIFYPVHEFGYTYMNTNQLFDQINEEIWKASRDGTVIIHCLAGMHRAPCVLVSQVLFRHYRKGQKHLDVDFDRVYKSLQSIRGGVAPLSYIDLLVDYKKYLQKQ